MKKIIYLTFIIILSGLSFFVLSQDMTSMKKMMTQQLMSSCNDKAFLSCMGITRNTCTSSTSMAIYTCDSLFPKTMNAMTDAAMNAHGECMSKNLLKNSGISADKLDTCSPGGGAPPMNDAQVMEKFNQTMKQFTQSAGTDNAFSGRPYVGSNNFDKAEVVKKYAELVYHVAANVSAHYRRPGYGVFTHNCMPPGKMTRSVTGQTIKEVYNNCYDSSFGTLHTNGVMIGKKINDSVSVTQLNNLTLFFEGNKHGYTVDGKVRAVEDANGFVTIINVGDVNFTYNLRNETWQHTVTDLKYTGDMFKINLTGPLYNALSAETIEPIRKGTGNQFGKIVSGKFKLSKGNKSAVITFIKPREILIERAGVKPVKMDWYGDPTTIYSEIPLELKY